MSDPCPTCEERKRIIEAQQWQIRSLLRDVDLLTRAKFRVGDVRMDLGDHYERLQIKGVDSTPDGLAVTVNER